MAEGVHDRMGEAARTTTFSPVGTHENRRQVVAASIQSTKNKGFAEKKIAGATTPRGALALEWCFGE